MNEEKPSDSRMNPLCKEPRTKKTRRMFISLGIAIAVIAATGIGFFMWHEQPSFCNAFCHSPMDPYVEGWQAQGESTLVGAHALAGITCLQCHESKITEQISEGMAWVSGSFSDPMEPRDLADDQFCKRCHTQEDIVAATENVLGSSGANPHAAHQDTTCGDCHSVHGTSTLVCNSCHVFEVPEGWQ